MKQSALLTAVAMAATFGCSPKADTAIPDDANPPAEESTEDMGPDTDPVEGLEDAADEAEPASDEAEEAEASADEASDDEAEAAEAQ